jgi:hypothetical protein
MKSSNPNSSALQPLMPTAARLKGTGAKRPKVEPAKGVMYGDEILPGESPKNSTQIAQRPKAISSEKDTRINRVNTTTRHPEDTTPQPEPAKSVYTYQSSADTNLKLRKQANKLGLIPGSPRWRAYVLGTISAIEKRKREKSTRAITAHNGVCNTRKVGAN